MTALDRLIDHLTRGRVNDRAVARLTAALATGPVFPTIGQTVKHTSDDKQAKERPVTEAERLYLSTREPALDVAVAFGGRLWLSYSEGGLPAGYECGRLRVADPFGPAARFEALLSSGQRYRKLEPGERNPATGRPVKSSKAWWDGSARKVVYFDADPNRKRRRGKLGAEQSEDLRSVLEQDAPPDSAQVAVLSRMIPSLTGQQAAKLRRHLSEKFGVRLAAGGSAGEERGRLEAQVRAILSHLKAKKGGRRVFESRVPESLAEGAREKAEQFGLDESRFGEFLKEHYDGSGDAQHWAGAYIFSSAPKEFPKWARGEGDREKLLRKVKGGDQKAAAAVLSASSTAFKREGAAAAEAALAVEPEKAAAMIDREVDASEGLTPKERRRVKGVLKSAYGAARRAGSAGNWLGRGAWWLLKKPLQGFNKLTDWGQQGVDLFYENVNLPLMKWLTSKVAGNVGGSEGKEAGGFVSKMAKWAVNGLTFYGLHFAFTQKLPQFAETMHDMMSVPKPVTMVAGGLFTIWAAVNILGGRSQKRRQKGDDIKEAKETAGGEINEQIDGALQLGTA